MNKEKVLEALFWFFIILGFILLIWKIVGDSPLMEQVFAAFIIGFLFKIYSKADKLEGKVHTEIGAIKERLTKLEESSTWIKNTLERFEAKLK